MLAMCSIIGGLKLSTVHSANLATTTIPDDMVQWCTAFTLVARIFAYVGILGLMMLVVFLIMKYLTDMDDERNVDERRNHETNPLRTTKAMDFSYGTCNLDLESGYCNIGSNSGSSNNSIPEELYDGKLCIICYDEERNCFFVPCGHCATCYICAQRIFHGENKACPVCRRFIGKVRKLFAS